MSRGLVPVLAVGAAIALGLWVLLDEPAPPEPPPEAVADMADSPRGAAPRHAQRLEARSDGAGVARPQARSAAAAPPPTLFGEFLGARSYRALYDRLQGSAEGQTGEGRLVLYEILRQCASITSGTRPFFRRPTPAREDFLATLAPSDPNRERRIAAYDEFTLDRCAGLEGVSTTQADLARLLEEAAAAGDPRARAIAIEQQMLQARREAGRSDAVTLSDAQVRTLEELAGTRDPEAIRVAGRVLANSWGDYALRIGPDQQPVEQRAFMNAWLVLACEYGAPCGPDTPRLQQACAFQGHCSAQNFPEYLTYYASSPHDSQMLMEYRGVIRQAIESGNWSQLQVVRGLPAPPNRIFFWPGPR